MQYWPWTRSNIRFADVGGVFERPPGRLLVDSVHHNYPSPMIDCPNKSLEPDLARIEAINVIEATQEQSYCVCPKALVPK
jgi:hypothetical protein